jgi:defect-in-organelle-trafficking protein DotB
MRQDPDVILVGEARSVKTIEASILGASTGHVLFTTVHAGSVAKIINRMVRSFESADRDRAQTDLVESLSLLVFQKLVRSTDGKRVALREYLIMDSKSRDALRQSPNLILDSFKVLFKSGYPLIKDIEEKYNQGLISEQVYKKERIEYLSQISHIEDQLSDELNALGV